MQTPPTPSSKLAARTLPKPLFAAIQHVFAQDLSGCALVGGTAIAGFYAGHRRSDDMDLFTRSGPEQKSAVLAVKSLSKIGVEFLDETTSQQYFHANCSLKNHHFTVDVVLDENLFRVGGFIKAEAGIEVANLETLYKMKIATLVSRCSEKDIYDLIWLSKNQPVVSISQMIEWGRQIDGGVSAENLLASVGGTTFRQEACDFSLSKQTTKAEIYKELLEFQRKLITELQGFLKKQPAPELGALVKRARKAIQ